ncbi:MAG: TonB family protein, partial [bacterium]
GGGHGSKFGYYAGQVKSRVLNTLLNHSKTRTAVMDVQVKIWVDSTGHITKVVLSKSTGDPAVDEALRNDALSNITLSEPPPTGMPMPIVMHFSARRPS